MLPEKVQTTDLVKVEKNGEPMTTSLKVAEVFGKQHKDVLKAIKSLQVPDTWHKRNFALTFQDVPGPNNSTRQEPYYEMTRKGFTILAMGFTGEKAMQFKLDYIEEFDRMECTIKTITENMMLATSERAQKALIDTVQGQAVELASYKEECRQLRNVAAKAVPVSEFGSLSPRNGMPRLDFRRSTFVAKPEPLAVLVDQSFIDHLQLQFDFQQQQQGRA